MCNNSVWALLCACVHTISIKILQTKVTATDKINKSSGDGGAKSIETRVIVLIE